jgi:SAM-dependent methyltransferase
VRRYEAVSGGVATLFPFVFSSAKSVLEIGAGSGRDAAALVQLGFDVHAIEPSDSLRERAVSAHPELTGRLFAGSLPHGLPQGLRDSYDGILMSAVIMHIPDAELFDSAFALRERLREGGKVLLSFATERSDVTPGSDRDPSGRLMIMRPVSQVKLLFERLGFSLESEWISADSAGRANVRWATLLFRRSDAQGRAIDRVESILNADRKTATYKLALVRALCDIAMTSWQCAERRTDGSLGVPIEAVAARWLRYYWPLIESGRFLPQINREGKGGKPIAFRKDLLNLVSQFRRQGGLSGFEGQLNNDRINDDVAKLHRGALRTIGSTIVKGPVQYAGNARGAPESAYDSESQTILVQDDVWRELSLMGHWIRDAVILRWAEMTSRLSGDDVSQGVVIDLLQSTVDALRMDPGVRSFYAGKLPNLRCVWTGRALTDGFAVDHAIPFAIWQGSPLWNLFPSTSKINSAKSDKLPTMRIVRARSEALVDCWRQLRTSFEARFDREVNALLGHSTTEDWENPLLTGFSEAIEYTASVRGTDRWEP